MSKTTAMLQYITLHPLDCSCTFPTQYLLQSDLTCLPLHCMETRGTDHRYDAKQLCCRETIGSLSGWDTPLFAADSAYQLCPQICPIDWCIQSILHKVIGLRTGTEEGSARVKRTCSRQGCMNAWHWSHLPTCIRLHCKHRESGRTAHLREDMQTFEHGGLVVRLPRVTTVGDIEFAPPRTMRALAVLCRSWRRR